MKKIFTSLVFISISSVFFFPGCHSTRKQSSGSQKTISGPVKNGPSGKEAEFAAKQNFLDSIPKITIDKYFKGDSLGSKFSIDTAFINNQNALEISVKYSGGCKDHDFKLFTNKAYMKSMPPQLNLFLTHNSHNDFCRDLISRTLYFNIAEIKYECQKKLLLIINGFPEKIEYLY